MFQVQEYLDQHYPKETRNSLKELIISQESLAGHLDLRDFVNLEILSYLNNQLTSLDLSNCQQLKWLHCGANQLTELNLTGLNQLERIGCNDNYLTNFDYTVCNPEKLTYLNISDNNLPTQDLAVFSQFTNLEELIIGGDDQEKFNQGIYNRFFGSLESLKDLKKLWSLVITNTDINAGLEYLPTSIKQIYCSCQTWSSSQVRELAKQLSQSQEYFLDEKGNYGLDNKYLRIQKETPNEAQEWLDWKYPLEKRKEITFLDINNKNLTGELVLSDWPNLKTINCRNNQLTKLIITNCPQLKVLNAWSNSLTDLVIDHPEQLTLLDIQNNNFPPQDLSFFSQFTNLEELWLNNNPFSGTLEPLRKLKKLKYLDISHTQVTTGLEYLPERTEEIILRRNSDSLKEISQELQLYSTRGRGAGSTYSVEQWRNTQPFYQQLKKALQKLGYSRLNELETDIFFSVRTGTFEGTTESLLYFLEQAKIISEKDENIRFLSRIIADLRMVIEKQKEKIVNSYLHFAPEKELLQKLIETRMAMAKLTRIANDEEAINQCSSQFYQLRIELASKLKSEDNAKVEIVLADCDKLVDFELDLENRINCQKVIDFPQQWTVVNIIGAPINSQEGNVIVGNIFKGDTNLSYNNIKLIESTKRPRRNSWEESPSTKSKISEITIEELEPVEIEANWTNIHQDFANQELVQEWLNNNFTYQQVQEWINAGFATAEANFCAWLRDSKQKTAEWYLNYGDLVELRAEYQATQFQAQQVQLPLRNN